MGLSAGLAWWGKAWCAPLQRGLSLPFPGEALGGSAAHSLNFGINTCTGSKIFFPILFPPWSSGLRLPGRGGRKVGQTQAALPTLAPCGLIQD